MSPAHVLEEKDDAYAADKETWGVDSEKFAVLAGGFVLAPGTLPLHWARNINPRELWHQA